MTGLRAVAAWLSLLGIAAYVRLSWVRCVSTVEGFDFADPDALYHLRQIRDGPMIRDWMLPDGLSPWPGGFDGVLAVLVRLGRLIGVRGTNAEEALVGTVLVLFSLWAVVLAWQVARASWGQAAGWIAALLVALIPAAIDRSRFGSIDHHLVEPIILLLALHPRLKARGRGIALGVGLVVSQSMMVAIGIAAVAMLAAKWRAREQELKVAEIATVALMVALPLVCVSAYAHGAWLDYRMVGLFQLGLLAVWALAAPIVDGPPARWRWQRAVGACVVLAALAAPLIRSASFLSRNRVVELAGESDSAFAASAFRLGYMTDLVWLWPVVLVWLGRRAWRSRNRS
ncbi:MAG: hypothetical protein KJO07_21065 [Deltaproteobacteria bacterium]|nr:hypothetical protein [Deltaproteobacteria bacterium]